MGNCNNCGTWNKNSTKFCRNCGIEFATENMSNKNKSVENRDWLDWLIYLGYAIFYLVATIIVGSLIFSIF